MRCCPFSSLTYSLQLSQVERYFPQDFPLYPGGYLRAELDYSLRVLPHRRHRRVSVLVCGVLLPRSPSPRRTCPATGRTRPRPLAQRPLTCNVTTVAPNCPVPPALLPYNRQPFASTYGNDVSYDYTCFYVYQEVVNPALLVSGLGDPRSELFAVGNACLVLSFSDGAHGEGRVFQRGLLDSGYVVDPAQALNNSVIVQPLPGTATSSGLYALSWAAVSASYYILPTAATYAGESGVYATVNGGCLPDVLSAQNAQSSEATTGVWVQANSLIALTSISGPNAPLCAYGYLNGTYGCWPLSQSNLPPVVAGGLSFTQGTIVARVVSWDTAQSQYFPLFTGSQAATNRTNFTAPFAGELRLALWSNTYIGGQVSVQVQHYPPPTAIALLGYSLNVSTASASLPSRVFNSSVLLPASATTATLNLSSPWPFCAHRSDGVHRPARAALRRQPRRLVRRDRGAGRGRLDSEHHSAHQLSDSRSVTAGLGSGGLFRGLGEWHGRRRGVVRRSGAEQRLGDAADECQHHRDAARRRRYRRAARTARAEHGCGHLPVRLHRLRPHLRHYRILSVLHRVLRCSGRAAGSCGLHRLVPCLHAEYGRPAHRARHSVVRSAVLRGQHSAERVRQPDRPAPLLLLVRTARLQRHTHSR